MKHQGYSLVEVLIAVAISVTLVASAAPAFLSIRDSWKLHNEVTRIAETLEQARLRAVLANTSVRVTAAGGEVIIRQSNADVRSLPLSPEILFAGAPKSILFSSRGTASPAATLLLTHKSRELSIVISPAGRVRIGP